MPTTLRPDSASSLARIVPVSPTPTTTTSTGVSLVAIAASSVETRQKHVLRMAVLVGRDRVALHVRDRHWLGVVGHAVLLDVLAVRGGDARESHELPRDLVAVAAVDRVGEEALHRVREQQIEEERPRQRRERELSGLELRKDLVLLRSQQLRKGLLKTEHAGGVHLRNRRAVDLLRRERRLVPLLRRALRPRPLPVVARHRAPGTGELLVDEVGDAGFLRSGAELVGRDEARDGGLEELDLRRSQVHVRLRQRCRDPGRLRLRPVGVLRSSFAGGEPGRHGAGCGDGGEAFQKTAAILFHAVPSRKYRVPIMVERRWYAVKRGSRARLPLPRRSVCATLAARSPGSTGKHDLRPTPQI